METIIFPPFLSYFFPTCSADVGPCASPRTASGPPAVPRTSSRLRRSERPGHGHGEIFEGKHLGQMDEMMGKSCLMFTIRFEKRCKKDENCVD